MSTDSKSGPTCPSPLSPVGWIILFCMRNRFLVILGVILIICWGAMVAPFDWELWGLPRDPVPVDAIPDLGENQQIVFTDWSGRSPQDIEDQVTYPLTVSLLGIPGVKTIRSQSMFGFSSLYVIFSDGVDFYWSRSRIIEKLNSLPTGILPEGVTPALGPDATALGQVFWYTLEGRDPEGRPAGGWDLQELRSVQDWYVRYGLLAAQGVSEVASIGGFVKEYQIDVDPDALRAYQVSVEDIYRAVRMSNVDVGARTIEINRVEYIIRGLGFIKSLADIENTVVAARNNTPILVKNVAHVSLGPALRRGALDKGGVEAVGGVVVVRHAANPLDAIKNVKTKIAQISPGLPTKAVIDYSRVTEAAVQEFASRHGFQAYSGVELNQREWLAWLRNAPRRDWPDWITTSHITVVPFYDRTTLIYETLGALNDAIALQVIITVIVVIVMLRHLRSSLLISAALPLTVLLCFIGMKIFGVQANIVALSGIAIAIGTIADMGIILCENTMRRLNEAGPDEDRFQVVFLAAQEVGGAVLTAVSTTVIGFLAVFTMTGPEGKLFRPLAYTKTFALIASVIIALTIIPTFTYIFLAKRRAAVNPRYPRSRLTTAIKGGASWISNGATVLIVGLFLTAWWLPLGSERSMGINFVFIALFVGGILVFFQLFESVYPSLLRWFLNHKLVYLSMPSAVLLFGAMVWLGVDNVLGFLPTTARQSAVWARLHKAFPGLGREFMPPLDEGSFLYMPSLMPHASIGAAMDVLSRQDKAISAIPEVESVVGKLGRVENALDPAPISMIETVINYKPEYVVDKDGRRIRFKFDKAADSFVRDAEGRLIPDPSGRAYRLWRDHIRTPNDLWKEIIAAAAAPGVTSAPKLQPIATRLVMLQTGMRAAMGIKVKGPDLATIQQVGLDIERYLKEIPAVLPETVFAERMVASPYLEIQLLRENLARYGIDVRRIQDVIETAIGGEPITTTVEGRERYGVRVRYQRELRDQIESLGRILVAAPDGSQIPLVQLADIEYVHGPQMIKSEDTFLTGYVTFDQQPGLAEVNVVETCRAYLQSKLDSGEWSLPAGVSYTFAGNYENQVHAHKTLAVVLPLSLFIIFVILYLQFRSISTTSLVFSGIVVSWAGGFLLIWLYSQPWFLDFTFDGVSMRTLFQVHPIMLSVAIWVGFLALFGIASDDGVVIATYLDQSFASREIKSIADIREAVVAGGTRRIRPCLMTTATTILALLPVLTSTGRGADVMVPMAIPSFGGMTIELMTLFLVPILYCSIREWRWRIVSYREDREIEEQAEP